MSKQLKNGSKGGDTSSDQVICTEAVVSKPLQVVVYNNNFEKAFRMFKALVQKERVLSTFKDNAFYEKPSVRKRRKRNQAARDRLEQENKNW